ncbi:MAG TPA: hypothetical protein VL523_13775 [Terriglobia bacterium]|nr:hypothetical protein [Terriglobia bacterium]
MGARSFRRPGGTAVALAMALAAVAVFAPASAHAQHKSKVPGLAKITSGGSGQQAYSGSVLSLDIKNSVLNVHSTQGDTVEIFPFKKNVRVDGADGEKLPLDGLKPGTSVLIYFEQKGNRRTAKQIVVLAVPPEGQKDKPVPPS